MDEDDCSPSEFNDGTMYRAKEMDESKDDLPYFEPPEKKMRYATSR